MSGARLLIVDQDDARVRDDLRLALEDEGYDVAEPTSAADAVTALFRSRPDAVLIDVAPGGTDRVDRIREIRRGHNLPIIALGARSRSRDVVAALEAGADDYVSTPFEIEEVTARLRALRRRAATRRWPDGFRDVVLETDPREPLVLSWANATVRRGDRDLCLTLTEYRLLCELANRPGEAMSRRTLVERVWESDFFGDDRIVDVHIRRLRTKIERDPAHPRAVVTVRGLGYRLDIRA